MQTTSGSRAIWPLAAICCLALLLFVICAAIVLALIPVYLPTRSISPAVDDNKSNEPFYLQYSAAADDNALPGDLEDLTTLQNSLGLPADVKVLSGQTATVGVDRRRRSFFGPRSKRDITIKILVVVQFVAVQCNTQCLLARKKFKTDLQSSKAISNVQCTINGGPLGKSIVTGLSLAFVGLSKLKPSGFIGPPPSIVFTTIKSGDFTDASIWDSGLLPGGPCDIVIAAGTVVTLSRPGLGIKAKSLTIYGTLILGGGNSAFTFKNAISMKIRKGGKVQDATTTKVIKVPLNSVIFIYLGGGFSEAGTTIQSYSGTGLGQSVTITTATGPFTCAILPTGVIRTASKITFFVVQSGPFKTGSTYCGGVAPTVDDCTDSPCGLEVLSGFTLSTADLNGQLDINIDTITIAEGATMQLGTPGSSSGFKFKYAVQLNIRGTLSFVASGGGIFLVGGSGFNLYGTGRFISAVATFIQVYDPITGANIGAAIILGTSLSGPYFVIIALDGGYIVTLIDPTAPTTPSPPVTVIMG